MARTENAWVRIQMVVRPAVARQIRREAQRRRIAVNRLIKDLVLPVIEQQVAQDGGR